MKSGEKWHDVSEKKTFKILYSFIQSTLVISKYKGLYETLRDIRTSTYAELRKPVNRTTTVKLAFAVAATTRKCRRGLLITGQLFICLPGVC